MLFDTNTLVFHFILCCAFFSCRFLELKKNWLPVSKRMLAHLNRDLRSLWYIGIVACYWSRLGHVLEQRLGQNVCPSWVITYGTCVSLIFCLKRERLLFRLKQSMAMYLVILSTLSIAEFYLSCTYLTKYTNRFSIKTVKSLVFLT